MPASRVGTGVRAGGDDFAGARPRFRLAAKAARTSGRVNVQNAQNPAGMPMRQCGDHGSIARMVAATTKS